jgi:hypothetical protein
MKQRILATILTFAIVVSLVPLAFAKTNPTGQTVGTVLFYVANAQGEQILVSQIPVAMLEADMTAGLIDDTVHNYSLLDKFTTTVHQEAQGFTVPDFIEYAQSKSPLGSLKSLPLELSGESQIAFWEIDQTGYDDMDSYTYADLYEVPRYNFSRLYEYWDYAKQDYYDPNGKMTKAEVIDYIFENAEPETTILSVRAFSQRYMQTPEKFEIDYNLESYWYNSGLLDNQRTIRVMIPMTKDELLTKAPTAMNSRYWTANILLNMENAPEIEPLGQVAAPNMTVTEDGENYLVELQTKTPGATILYNHNYDSPSYTPTEPYSRTLTIPKADFPSGTITLTVRAVKKGYTDVGEVTRKVNPSAASEFSDVPNWAQNAITFVAENNLVNANSAENFGASDLTTRGELAIALYRLEGSPEVKTVAEFSDVPKSTELSKAVSWANANDVIAGNGDGAFTPNNSITREMIAVMFLNYARYKGADTTANGDLSVFTDSDETANWAKDGLSWAVAHKIFSGNGNGTITPKATSTSAMVAQILYNYMKG